MNVIDKKSRQSRQSLRAEAQRDHDHYEDVAIGGDTLVEAAYRRGCQQSLAMALRQPTHDQIAFLTELEQVVAHMRFSRKLTFPWFMHEAIERTYRKLRMTDANGKK
jgi:hypothetical protein